MLRRHIALSAILLLAGCAPSAGPQRSSGYADERLVLDRGLMLFSEPSVFAPIQTVLVAGDTVAMVRQPSGSRMSWRKVRPIWEGAALTAGWIVAPSTSHSTRGGELRRQTQAHLATAALDAETEIDFLRRVEQSLSSAPESEVAKLELVRLVAVERVLDALALEQRTAAPADVLPPETVRDLQQFINYAEVQGQWMLGPEAFWALSQRYQSDPLAETIAWRAAHTRRGGECEGDLACYLWNALEPIERYLRLHPAGAHAQAASRAVLETLRFALDELRDPQSTYGELHCSDLPFASLDHSLTPVNDPAARTARILIPTLLAACAPDTPSAA